MRPEKMDLKPLAIFTMATPSKAVNYDPEIVDQVEQIMLKLMVRSPDCYSTLCAVYLFNLTSRQIAKRRNIPLATIHSWRKNGLQWVDGALEMAFDN